MWISWKSQVPSLMNFVKNHWCKFIVWTCYFPEPGRWDLTTSIKLITEKLRNWHLLRNCFPVVWKLFGQEIPRGKIKPDREKGTKTTKIIRPWPSSVHFMSMCTMCKCVPTFGLIQNVSSHKEIIMCTNTLLLTANKEVDH